MNKKILIIFLILTSLFILIFINMAKSDTVTATFGYTTIGTSGTINAYGNIFFGVKSSPIYNGTMQTISIYDNGGTSNMRVALYDTDINGFPTNLLNESESEECIAGQWHNFSVVYPVIAAHNYWLAFQQDTNTVTVSYDSVSSASRYTAYAYAAFPATYTTGTPYDIKCSIYATYTYTTVLPTPTPTPTSTPNISTSLGNTQILNTVTFFILFIFFIILNIVFVIIKLDGKEIIGFIIMIFSVIIGFAAMWQYDQLLTLVFVIINVFIWFMNILKMKW